MEKVLLILLILSSTICLILFTYPIVAYVRTLLMNRPVDNSTDFIQPVSIIIAAYNEENSIRNKLNFFLKEEEWVPGSEIIVISAGSTDRTNEILKEFEAVPAVQLILIKEHMVKPLALNIAVARSKNDLLIFSDCRQSIQNGSIKKLVRYFSDKDIGTVNSTISDTKPGGKISFLRWISNSICLNDSISGSSLNIHGALYAQRKELFRAFPNDILLDDLFAIVSTIIQNKRLVQARDVVIYDIQFDTYYGRNRIERLVRGLMVFLLEHWISIKRLPVTVLIRFILFKYVKLLLPFLMIGVCLPLFYFLIPVLSNESIIALLGMMILLLTFKKSRRFILLFLRINICFTSAVFKFFVLKKRELSWEKLTLEQIS